MIQKLTVDEVEFVAYELANVLMQWDEPIPAFKTRYPGVLESCLSAPFQTFDKKDLVAGLIPKAALLFYLMIKNHPFENGNKRLAVTTLLCFLRFNNKWIEAPPDELYKLAVHVAESRPKDKNHVIHIIESLLNDYVTNR